MPYRLYRMISILTMLDKWILGIKKKQNTFFTNHLSFFPLLLLDNDRKFLLPFLRAIVNFCCNSKGRIGFLIYELKRTTKELQFDIWNPTLRKVSMQLRTKLNIYLFLGLKAAAVTMKRSLKPAFLLYSMVSIHPWPSVNSGSGTPSGYHYNANFLLLFFFFFPFPFCFFLSDSSRVLILPDLIFAAYMLRKFFLSFHFFG